MKKNIIVFYFILISSFLLSQTAPDTLWTKTYGSIGNERGQEVIATSDNGFLIIGSSSEIGIANQNIYLIKTDSNGEAIWTKSFGEILDNYGYSVVEVSDGYVITGWTDSYGATYSSILFIKTDFEGNSLITKCIDLGNYCDGYCIKQTNDNGFIFTGWVRVNDEEINLLLLKTDANGNLIWNKNYGGENEEIGYQIQQTTDEGFIIVGKTDSYGSGGDVYLIKTNSLGDTLWTRNYGGNTYDVAFSIKETEDNGFIIVGETVSFGNGLSDAYLIKTNSIGDTLWTKTFGGINSDIGKDIQITQDGGFVFTGYTKSYGTANNDLWIVKTDSNGILEWMDTVSYPSGDYHYASFGWSIKQTLDGNFIITGDIGLINFDTDVFLVRYGFPLTADFSVDYTNGYFPELEVNFYDNSFGEIPINWFWDFQNDGIYDSFEQNPTFTYTEVGTYDVKLKVTSATQVDSLIKNDYITVSYVPAEAPSNVQIELINNDVSISWSKVDSTIYGTPINVDYYLIFGSYNPNSDFMFLGATPDTTFIQNYVLPVNEKMFYKIKSYIGTREELESDIKKFYQSSKYKYLIKND